VSADPPLLSLDGITKQFGRVTVASDLSLSVGPDQAIGIVGPNGAGKTTLFSIISGDVRPDAGEVTFGGRRVTSLDAATRCRLGIGRTYQVPRSFENMTVFENVVVAAQQGAGLRRGESHAQAVSALDSTELTAVANRRAGQLTLLQRKRLEIARALATGPKLLLLDEVAGGLTEPEVAALVDIVRRVRAGGLAVVWIEHVVRALIDSVDRLLCLAAGAIIADGPPAEVLASRQVREVYLGGGLELQTAEPAQAPEPDAEP